MTSYSICISAVVIMWGNYNYGVIYKEVKNTPAQRVLHSGRRCGCRIVSESLRWDSDSFFHFLHHYALLRNQVLYNDIIMTLFLTRYDTSLDLQSKDAPLKWEGSVGGV